MNFIARSEPFGVDLYTEHSGNAMHLRTLSCIVRFRQDLDRAQANIMISFLRKTE